MELFMIYYLVLSCTLLSLSISLMAMIFFSKSINAILTSVLPKELALAWSSYMRYMIVVVGLGGGVRIYNYEKYLESSPPNLTTERWVLELYETLLNTLSSIGWLVFWLFLAAMIVFISVKMRDKKKTMLNEGHEIEDVSEKP